MFKTYRNKCSCSYIEEDETDNDNEQELSEAGVPARCLALSILASGL
jgi:hypothetical protein